MNSLFILCYWQNSVDRIKVGIFVSSLKKVVFTLKLLGGKDTWVSENIQGYVCTCVCGVKLKTGILLWKDLMHLRREFQSSSLGQCCEVLKIGIFSTII